MNNTNTNSSDASKKKKYKLRKNKIISIMKTNIIILLIVSFILGFTFFILNKIFNNITNIDIFFVVFSFSSLIFFIVVIPVPNIIKKLEREYKTGLPMLAYEEFLLMFYSILGKPPAQILNELKRYFEYPEKKGYDVKFKKKEYDIRKERLLLILRSLIGSIIFVMINVGVLIALLSELPSFGIIAIPLIMEIFKIYKLIVLLFSIRKLDNQFKENKKLTADNDYFEKYIANSH